jgi:hypothetical protein
MSGKQLGFIGVGTMGHHMAGRLLEAGYSLVIFDTNETAMQRLEQRGAKRAASAADVASQCETILVSLPTPDVVKAVAYGEQGEGLRRSFHHRLERRQGGRGGFGGERHHGGRCAGERRADRRGKRHARNHDRGAPRSGR